MQRTVTTMLCALALVALAPFASAASYTLCTPGSNACFVQEDSRYAGQNCNAYSNAYGVNTDRDAVVLAAPGANFEAGGRFICANWFYGDYDYQGVYATGSAGGRNVNVVWHRFIADYHWPGAPKDQRGEYVTATATDPSGSTGVAWQRTVVTEGTPTESCTTTVYVLGASTAYGCPAGGPPPPPNLPWGAILP